MNVEVYESVAAVISRDVIQQLSQAQLETFKSYLLEKGGRLVKDGELCIIHASSAVVNNAKVYLNQELHAEVSKEPEFVHQQSDSQNDGTLFQPCNTVCSKETNSEVTNSTTSEVNGSEGVLSSQAGSVLDFSEGGAIRSGAVECGHGKVQTDSNCKSTKETIQKDCGNGNSNVTRRTRGNCVDVLAVLGKRKRQGVVKSGDQKVTDKRKKRVNVKPGSSENSQGKLDDSVVEKQFSEQGIVGKNVKREDGNCEESLYMTCSTEDDYMVETGDVKIESTSEGVARVDCKGNDVKQSSHSSPDSETGNKEVTMETRVCGGSDFHDNVLDVVKDGRSPKKSEGVYTKVLTGVAVRISAVDHTVTEGGVDVRISAVDHAVTEGGVDVRMSAVDHAGTEERSPVKTEGVNTETEGLLSGVDVRKLPVKQEIEEDTRTYDGSIESIGIVKKPKLKLSKDVIRFLKKSKKKDQVIKHKAPVREEVGRSRTQKPNFSEEVKELLKRNAKKEAKLRKETGGSQGTVAMVTEEDRTCRLCGYVAASLQGIRLHNYTYHRDHQYQCDICFTTFPMRHMVDRHRKHHFDTEGKLKASAISVHKMKLAELGYEENLTSELAEQVAADDTPLPEVKYKKEELTECDMYLTDPSLGGEWAECDICFARLSSQKFLKTHKMRVHSNNKEKKKTTHVQQQVGQKLGVVVRQQYYKCPKCEFTTTRIQNYTKHYDTHNKPAFYHCEICPYKNTVKAEITRHTRNSHFERHLPCPYCQVKFRNPPQLNAHIKIKHLKHNSQMCEECGKVLSCKYSYRQHLKTHHEDPTIQPGDKIICQDCGRLFTTVGAFHTHQEKFHADVEENLLREPKDVSEGVLVLNGGQLFQCKHCLAYTNSSAREVRLHIVRMHLKKTHACPYCAQAFPRETFLEKHIATHHLYLYNVDCDECDRSFKNKSYLLFHKRRVHMKDLPFECEVCKKTFHRKVDYQSHIEIHKPAEERDWKFSCEICLRRFRHRNNLTYHMLEHTGVRAFHCSICKKSFKTKTVRNYHVQTHSEARPVECPLCDKTFKQSKYLDYHLLTHNSCSYSCKACCRLFPHLKALEKHVCRAVKLFNSDKKESGSEVIGDSVDIDTTPYTITDIPVPSTVDAESLGGEGYTGIPQSEPVASYSTLILEPDTALYNLNPEGLCTTSYMTSSQSSLQSSLRQHSVVISNSTPGIGQNSLIINRSLSSLGSLSSVITEDSIHGTPETVIQEHSDHSGSVMLQQLHGLNKEITVSYQGRSIESELKDQVIGNNSEQEGVDPRRKLESISTRDIDRSGSSNSQYVETGDEGDIISQSGNVVDHSLCRVKVESDILPQETVAGFLTEEVGGGGDLEKETGECLLITEGSAYVDMIESEKTEYIGGDVSQSEVYMCGECQAICTAKVEIHQHMLEYHQHNNHQVQHVLQQP